MPTGGPNPRLDPMGTGQGIPGTGDIRETTMTQPKHIILWQRVENALIALGVVTVVLAVDQPWPLAAGRATEQGSEPHPTGQNAGPR